ncbi:MAG: cellulose synthase [Actinomycetes bacterium]
MTFDDVAWFPLSVGLTALGLAAAVAVTRRRGLEAGARVAAWALVPLGLYLVGATQVVWRVGTALTRFVTGFAFSPRVWLGVVVLATSAGLFLVTSRLRRRVGGGRDGAVEPAEKRGRTKDGGDSATAGFEDVEEILRRRGIG